MAKKAGFVIYHIWTILTIFERWLRKLHKQIEQYCTFFMLNYNLEEYWMKKFQKGNLK